MKRSTASTTSSVRSMEVPAGSSYAAVKIALSDGGKKMFGMIRKPCMASRKTATTPARVSAGRRRQVTSSPR